MGDDKILGNDPTGAGQTRIQTDLIKAETEKIDNAAADGLTGVSGSVAYEVEEIERHHHNYERWMAEAAVRIAGTHEADSISDSQASFQADGGNNAWGPWVQIFGSDDTPVRTAQLKFDLHRLLIVDHEHNTNCYLIQIGFGASGAAALSAETYTEITIVTGGGNTEVGPIDMLSRRQDSGTKVWARVWAVGQNTGTLNFFVGIHEYEG